MINTVNIEKEVDIQAIKANKLSNKDYRYFVQFCTIIQRRHYGYIQGQTQEDLISVGVYKCVQLIQKGTYDCKKGPLKNFLFTGVRNEMQNYLYGFKREIPVEEVFEEEGNSFRELKYVTKEEVVKFLMSFRSQFRIYVHSILAYLFLLGVPAELPERDKIVDQDQTVRRLTCLFLWTRQESSVF